jgi:hypothetical protein
MAPYLHEPDIAVLDADEYVGMLLDEWDTYITQCKEALCDSVQARIELELTREPMAIMLAEALLAAAGHTEAERRAHDLLALRQHDG